MENITPYTLPVEEFSPNEEKQIRPIRQTASEVRRMANISIIVAAAADNAIGKAGGLIWHIPADLKRFKSLTMGHAIVMGRKTWQSLPKGALPGRRNIVISRDPAFNAPGAEIFTSLEDALAECAGDTEIFVIGGGQIYAHALEYATRVYMTRVAACFPDADTFFPELPGNEWALMEASAEETTAEGLTYKFENFIRHEA